MKALILAVALVIAFASAASAQSLVVALPPERLSDFRAAIRLELDPRTQLDVVGLTPSTRATIAELAHVEALRRNATRVVWIEFASGDLRPPTLYVDDIPSTGIRTHILPSAYDVLEPRVFALSLVSLLDAPEVAPAVAPAAELTSNTELSAQAASMPSAESAPPTPPAAPPRRRVHSTRFDGEQWAMRLGGEVGMLKLGAFNAFAGGVHAGIGGYLAGRIRVDGDYYFSWTSEVPFAFRGGIGASYFFQDPAGVFSTLLGARFLIGVNTVPVNDGPSESRLWFGAGAFFGIREHLADHWALEQRVQADVIPNVTGNSRLGFAATFDATVEYIF